jgi:hypothetical protein
LSRNCPTPRERILDVGLEMTAFPRPVRVLEIRTSFFGETSRCVRTVNRVVPGLFEKLQHPADVRLGCGLAAAEHLRLLVHGE